MCTTIQHAIILSVNNEISTRRADEMTTMNCEWENMWKTIWKGSTSELAVNAEKLNI
jgi:hypothetical protein